VPAAAIPAAARNIDRRDQLLLLIADMVTSLSLARLRLHGSTAEWWPVAQIEVRSGTLTFA
jgi:hypothetical protein